MPSKFLNLSTDTTLGGATPSDELAVSQRAIKLYVDSQSGGGGSGSAQSVGNVFWTMRTDNELNGAVECNGATYDTGDFTGSGSIGTLLAAGRVPYVSLAQYATLLSSQGSCGVFGWDGGSATEFRVPSLNDIFIETGTAAQVGDYLPAGLPNITGTVKTGILWNGAAGATGCFTESGSGGNKAYDNGSDTIRTADFDASRSSAIYGNSTTVQPNTVRYRAMVQLATGATDEALETCTSVLADVAGLKSHEVIAFQAPTAENNYTWYRKYADGWVEQGGIHYSIANNSNYKQTFPIEMADSNYTATMAQYAASDPVAFYYNQGVLLAKTTTGITLSNRRFNGSGTYSIDIMWQVSGMSAS